MMKVELHQARGKDIPVLRRLMQLYLYDFAAIDDGAIADDGLYGDAATIESFWTDPRMTSFLVRVDGTLAGFVLVRDRARYAGDGTREVSEFFILRRHRRRGVGGGATDGWRGARLRASFSSGVDLRISSVSLAASIAVPITRGVIRSKSSVFSIRRSVNLNR